MTQSISNTFRITAAEQALERHNHCFNRVESAEEAGSFGATEEDAEDLLISLSLWASVNGFCLRVPKPVYACEEGGEHV
jgi:hypothetical protein